MSLVSSKSFKNLRTSKVEEYRSKSTNTKLNLILSILKDKGFIVRQAANYDQALLEINKKSTRLLCLKKRI